MHGMQRLPQPIEPLLSRFRAELTRSFGARVREVVLFGSWARGEADEESDVDVLVVVDDLTSGERRQIVDLAYDVDRASGEELRILSPLAYSSAQANDLRRRERRLLRDVDREGMRM